LLLGLNIRGLTSHIDDFALALESNKLDPSIITLYEHWLSPDSLSVVNKLNGYSLIANYNRQASRHGGVCILMKSHIQGKPCPSLGEDSTDFIFECTAAEFVFNSEHKTVRCVVVALYRTPDSDFEVFMVKFDKLLEKLSRMNRSNMFFICGDFNVDLLLSTNRSRRFLNVVHSYNFHTVFKNATRITNSSATCIDNVITNVDQVFYHGQIDELGISDHCSLNMFLNGVFQIRKRKVFQTRAVTDSMKLKAFTNNISQDKWSSCLSISASSGAYNEFLRKFHLRFLESFPMVTIQIHPNSDKGRRSWMSRGLKVSSINKRHLFQLSKINPDPNFQIYFKKYKKTFKKTIQAAKSLFNNKMINDSKNTTKAAWEVVKREAGLESRNESCDVIMFNGKKVTNVPRICDIFNESFSSIGLLFGEAASPLISKTFLEKQNKVTSVFKFCSISQRELQKIIYSFENKHSTGWDEIPISVIKAVSPYILRPLTHIINTTLSSGVFPDKLKFSVITPVFKDGDRTNIDNYRPIALLSTFSKIIEKVALKQVLDYFERNGLFNNCQFGFRRGRTTKMAVFELIMEILRAFEGSDSAMGIFCDLSKSFDCVRHDLLLMKLKFYGFQGSSLRFFKTYLTGRFQRVKIKDVHGRNHFSSWKRVSTGVPQGSLLGPLLFIIYVNDLSKCIPIKLFQFADDTAAVIRNRCGNELQQNSKAAIETLNEWFRANGLRLNTTKTNLMLFQPTARSSNTGQLLLDSKSSVKFLGINVQDTLKWSCHADALHRNLGKALFVLRSLRDCVDRKTALSVYNGYFASHIRYSIVFWGSSSHARSILKLQKRALRIIFNLKYRDSCRPYFKKFDILTVPALYIHELLNFMNQHFQYFTDAKPKHGRELRNQCLMLYPVHRLSLFEKGPYYMGLRLFNGLPDHLKAAFQTQKFSGSLKKFLASLCPYSLAEYFER
jgi:hypothetical protein